ncbi:chemotaxis protein CheD [uncultured Gammaproteobacteria bacterium]
MSCHHKAPGRPTLNLMAGEIYCDRRTQVIGTILGSCVSVCLWDPSLRYGGMNHFILPSRPMKAELSTRYGDDAIRTLVQGMLNQGSRLTELQAKVFGGGNVLRTGVSGGAGDFAVGRRNAEVALSELNRLGIPIVASRVSGEEGVALLHCTECGDVWLRLIIGTPPATVAGAFSELAQTDEESSGGAPQTSHSRRRSRLAKLIQAQTQASSLPHCPTCGIPPQARHSRG